MAEKVDPVKAAAERKKVLKRFGLTEIELKSIRKLGEADEIKWRIENMYENGLEFLKERRKFMLQECVPKVTMRAAPKVHVTPRETPARRMGTKVG